MSQSSREIDLKTQKPTIRRSNMIPQCASDCFASAANNVEGCSDVDDLCMCKHIDDVMKAAYECAAFACNNAGMMVFWVAGYDYCHILEMIEELYPSVKRSSSTTLVTDAALSTPVFIIKPISTSVASSMTTLVSTSTTKDKLLAKPTIVAESTSPRSAPTQAPAAEAQTDGTESQRESRAWVAGPIIGVAVGILLLQALLWFCYRRRRAKAREGATHIEKSQIRMVSNGDTQKVEASSVVFADKHQYHSRRHCVEKSADEPPVYELTT